MIKTSDKYKQKIIILKNKKDNEAQVNDNVNKFLDEYRVKIDDVDGVDVIPLKANRRARREAEREISKDFFRSNKLYNFTRKDRGIIDSLIRETLKQYAYNNEANQFLMYIDLTDDSIKDSFKNFDDPNFEVMEIDKNFYFIRPKEQTKAERQTETYILEQLLDILKGSKKPEVTFVIKTDKDYNQKIYVYDGQHRLLLVVDFMFNGKTFSIKALKEALVKKEKHFGKDNWPAVWKSFDEFAETFDGEEFDYEQLTNSQPEIKDVFKDPEKMLVYGNLHFCDSKTASLLFKKLNEHVSSHSTTQRVKSDLSDTEFSELLFGSELKINDEISGYLSDLVPDIDFFNRKGVKFPKLLPKDFSYDISSSDQKQMNFDQYLIYIYQMILAKVKQEMIPTKEGEHKLIYKFDINCSPVESMLWGGQPFQNEAWGTYGIKEKMYEFWFNIFSNLIIDDKDTFVDYVENLIKIANLVTSDEFLNRVGRWAKEIDKLRKPYLDEIKTIGKKYPNKDSRPNDIMEKLGDLEYKEICLKKHKLFEKDQLVVFSTITLHTYLKKFKIEDWFNGQLDCMLNTFNDIVKIQQDKIWANRKRGTKHRGNFLFENYGSGNFQSIVSGYLESVDESLWSRFEVNEYFDDILDHGDNFLYICPHTCKPVTKDNFHSHHLHFRSSGDAHKVFKYWFPLSSKFNQYISDNRQKNIVDVNSDGSVINACDTMIDMMKSKLNNTSDRKEIRLWNKSIGNIELWRDSADEYLGENI